MLSDTDFLHVERSVKGDAANLSLYSKVLSGKIDKRKSSQIQSPPSSEKIDGKVILKLNFFSFFKYFKSETVVLQPI